MAKSEIKKYDDLPGVVNFIDVDALRAALNWKNERISRLEKEKEYIIKELEEALRKHKSNEKQKK
jgi:hypothetical protein